MKKIALYILLLFIVFNGTAQKIQIDSLRWYIDNTPASNNQIDEFFNGTTPTNSAYAAGFGYGLALSSFDIYYPLLPGEHWTIDSIRLYDGSGTTGNASLKIYMIDSLWNKTYIGGFKGASTNVWTGVDTANTSAIALSTPKSGMRYIVFNINGGIFPTEIEFYGPHSPPTGFSAFSMPKVPLKNMLGVNAFEWNVEDPNNPSQPDTAAMSRLIGSFNGIRHYLDWDKLENRDSMYSFAPATSGGWNYDTMYYYLKLHGVEVLGDIKTQPGWMLNTYPSLLQNSENVPVVYDSTYASFSNPNSYRAFGKVAFQYAARYGRNSNIDTTLIQKDTTTQAWWEIPRIRRTGLDRINYMECDNERDKWWKGRDAYQTGREYAANLSAFYDGNKHTMGPGVGVKTADSTMQVVMAGLADPVVDYVKGMVDWCKQYRGYKSNGHVDLCWDVINVHYYNNDGFSQGGTATHGMAPELAGAGTMDSIFAVMSHQYCYDMPVWITECGYDLLHDYGSTQYVLPITGSSKEKVQGDWNLRTALEYSRRGASKVMFYQLYDDNARYGIQFATCGFIDSLNHLRPGANYFGQVKNKFGNYTYDSTLSQDARVDRYDSAGKKMFAMWIPDQINRTGTYTLPVNVTLDSVYVYKLDTASTLMKMSRIVVTGGIANIPITETPVFVTFSLTGASTSGGSTGGSGGSGVVTVTSSINATKFKTPITWVVSNTTGISYYRIQKKALGTTTFYTIGFHDNAVISTSPVSMSYVDSFSNNCINVYLIVAVKNDSSTVTSVMYEGMCYNPFSYSESNLLGIDEIVTSGFSSMLFDKLYYKPFSHLFIKS